jgi:hypothetical protein
VELVIIVEVILVENDVVEPVFEKLLVVDEETVLDPIVEEPVPVEVLVDATLAEEPVVICSLVSDVNIIVEVITVDD